MRGGPQCPPGPPAPQERKSIIQSKPQEKHFNWGSLLLGVGVAISIEGPVNTYLRTGGRGGAGPGARGRCMAVAAAGGRVGAV